LAAYKAFKLPKHLERPYDIVLLKYTMRSYALPDVIETLTLKADQLLGEKKFEDMIAVINILPLNKRYRYCNAIVYAAHYIIEQFEEEDFYNSVQDYTLRKLIASTHDMIPLPSLLEGLRQYAIATMYSEGPKEKAFKKATQQFQRAIAFPFEHDLRSPHWCFSTLVGLYASLQQCKLYVQSERKMTKLQLAALVRTAGLALTIIPNWDGEKLDEQVMEIPSLPEKSSTQLCFYKHIMPDAYIDPTIPLFDYDTHFELLLLTSLSLSPSNNGKELSTWWDYRVKELLDYYYDLKFVRAIDKADILGNLVQMMELAKYDKKILNKFKRQAEENSRSMLDGLCDSDSEDDVVK
jgi:hypothetical protein